MIKDIVVNLGLTAGKGYAADYAISVAEAFGAHLAGVAFVYDAIVPISGGGYIPADLIDAQVADNKAAAQAALDRFTASAKRQGVAFESVMLSASTAGAAEQFSRVARRFDIAIVGQAEPETFGIEQIMAETALFESGRPLIVVPYIQKASLKLDNVMVCWDGSRTAARAIADAMPFLERAKRVEVVIAANERGKQDEIAGADMGEHLARHGLKVEVNRSARGDIDVADLLLSHAADSGADFIVMGGYGHSRWREFVLGGVTQGIFRSMTAPVLMAH